MERKFFALLFFLSCTSAATQFIFISDLHFDPFGDTLLYNQSTFCRPPKSPRARIPEDVKETLRFRRGLVPAQRFSGDGKAGEPVNWGPAIPLGRYSCDSPGPLVESALAAAASSVARPPFVIFAGDAAAHDLDEAAQVGAVSWVVDQFSKRFPGVPVVSAVGNNDVFPAYSADCSSPGLADLAKIWREHGWLPGDQVATFLRSGAFSRSIGSLRFISLDTNMFHPKGKRVNSSEDDDCGQFAFLDLQLAEAEAANQSVYIIGHVPPSWDTFSRDMLWKEAFIERFTNVLAAHAKSEVVRGVFAGHVHADEFRILKDVSGASVVGSVVTANAVSPIYYNNPSFVVFTSAPEQRHALFDFTTFYLDLREAAYSPPPRWRKGYSFGETYGKPDVSTKSLSGVLQNLVRSSTEFSHWRVQTTANYIFERDVICTLDSATEEQYQACIKSWN